MVAVAGQRGGPDGHYSSAKLGANYSDKDRNRSTRAEIWQQEQAGCSCYVRWLDDRRRGPRRSIPTSEISMSFVLSRVYTTIYRRVGPVYLAPAITAIGSTRSSTSREQRRGSAV
jgi:hypothetical protein